MQSTTHTSAQIQSYQRIRSARLHVLATELFGRDYSAFIAPNGFYSIETSTGRALAARSLPGLIALMESI